MLDRDFTNKIDGLWETFWTGGLTNPLDVIEQMTYLMFVHDLSEADTRRAKDSVMMGIKHVSIFDGQLVVGDRSIDKQLLKWSKLVDCPDPETMFERFRDFVFPFLKGLHNNKDSAYSKYMSDAVFKIPTPLLLQKILDKMNEIYKEAEKEKEKQKQQADKQALPTDIRGDIYEYLLSKIASAGVNGQFRTPRHIIRMMVELMAPQADDLVCDPACGTSGFLVSVCEYLREKRKQEIFRNKENKAHFMNNMFHGYDMDHTMLRIGAMNMMHHGVDNPHIEYRDSLAEDPSDDNGVLKYGDRGKYDLILANPPFKGSLDAAGVADDLKETCNTKKTELLFLALFVKLLTSGGRCACIVPDGVLFGSSAAHKAIRKELVEKQRLVGVISMPSGVFKPYAGVSTAILIFTKTDRGGTDNVWFYDMKADGYSLDDKRGPIAENDIPDIIERFRNLDKEAERQRTDQSFFVPKKEIVDNDYDLSINKYKKVEYVAVQYPPSSEIIAELREIEAKIAKEMDALEALLK